MATAASASATIDTSKVSNRRILRFNSIDELLTDIDRLAAAERSGRLTQHGNWTLGQALGHLATWGEFIYDGAPIKPPFFIRWIIRLQKRKFLAGPLPAGVTIPNIEGGTLGTEPMSLDAGLARYQTTMRRLKVEPPILPSPIFGKLTHEETIALALRHAELHLSFFEAT